jgi:hypothetical protein
MNRRTRKPAVPLLEHLAETFPLLEIADGCREKRDVVNILQHIQRRDLTTPIVAIGRRNSREKAHLAHLSYVILRKMTLAMTSKFVNHEIEKSNHSLVIPAIAGIHYWWIP